MDTLWSSTDGHDQVLTVPEQHEHSMHILMAQPRGLGCTCGAQCVRDVDDHDLPLRGLICCCIATPYLMI